MSSYLIKTCYSGDNLQLWYWDDEKQKIEKKLKSDNHLPYLITDEESLRLLNDKHLIISTENIKKYDSTKFSEVQLVKVCTKSPADIFDKRKKTGLRTMFKNSWEDNIKYDICYVIDTDRCYCLPDNVVKKETVKSKDLKIFFFKHFYTAVTYKFFNMPIKCLDIEVREGKLDAKRAEGEIICCSIISEKCKRIYVHKGHLDSSILALTKTLNSFYTSTKGEKINYEIVVCDNEFELLKNVYHELWEEILLYTFNGDEFDLPYLFYRGKNLGLKEDEIPIDISFDGYRTTCTLKNGLHIDIQRAFETGILTYSYPVERYPSLDDVALAIVGERKLKQPSFDKVSKGLCDYCVNDSELLFKIVTHEHWTFQLLLITLSRLYNISLEDLTRTSLSRLNYKLFQYAHRLVNYLIPNKKYFDMKNAELKDKIPSGKSGTYKGGDVYISNPGIYFDIDVYDYTSEYPGVADAENLSYETINCSHPECKSNIVPDHGFHICKKEKGIVSALLGAIRDLRIHFKNTLKKNGTIFDRVVVGALKICVLSSYGMFGMSGHEVEMPAIASSITFFGRKNLSLGQVTASELGYKCLYGDTDSIFINHLNDKERERLIEELKRRTKIEIDFDKRYKYVIISRKKNYLGCGYDGRIDIKGMSGKKRHQCLFLKNVFNEILNVLRGINKIEDLNIAKDSIEKIVHDKLEKLKLREVKLEDLSFRVRLSKDISAKGQPYDVARLYLANGIKKQNGDFVEYVLTKGVYSAKPTFIARISEIDVDGYIQRLEGMLKQIFEPLDMNVKEVLYGKNMSLESFSDDNAKLPNFESKFREGIEKWFEE